MGYLQTHLLIHNISIRLCCLVCHHCYIQPNLKDGLWFSIIWLLCPFFPPSWLSQVPRWLYGWLTTLATPSVTWMCLTTTNRAMRKDPWPCMWTSCPASACTHFHEWNSTNTCWRYITQICPTYLHFMLFHTNLKYMHQRRLAIQVLLICSLRGVGVWPFLVLREHFKQQT